MRPLVLAFPEFDSSLRVNTDASSRAIGAVLAQKASDGNVHPTNYASRSLNGAEKEYSTSERAYLAVVFALEKFRVYLIACKPFELVNDHQALQ